LHNRQERLRRVGGTIVSKSALRCLVLALLSTATAIACASAAELPMKAQPVSWAYCQAPDAPYKNYACLDDYLGQDFLTRLINYYRLEWGHDAAPADPKAPPSSRPGWPATPQTTPPMPFTEWPYGGTTSIGVTRPNSVDTPFMNAISNTAFGKFLQDAHIQIYGWVDGGGNLSTNGVRPGGNAPVAYDYTPNTFQFDQGVLFIERLPDTVQTDHIDWGFRFSGLYGQNYRYMTSFGIASYQLLGHNLINGYDFPMEYGELYIPNIGQGLLLRLGRFLAVPDIESQLAPTNYMYSHSLTYWLDNYTNTGLLTTYAVTKNWFLQFGVTAGTDTAPWNMGKRVPNPFPNPVYPGGSMLKDPGAMPSLTGCTRYTTDSGRDSIYLCANAENTGAWGYDNLQWYGGTYYHKFNDQWHISVESYMAGQRNVLNRSDPAGIIANGGFPFSTQNGFAFNAPNTAICANPQELACTARAFGIVEYLNYRMTSVDNISFRAEFFNDENGQRTGVKTRYVDVGLGWQHWFSPQVYIRPEVSVYQALDAPAFNANTNLPAGAPGSVPNKRLATIVAMDLICRF
jgi:Putative beta-barrel porin-2, OmpL-like. bbp2